MREVLSGTGLTVVLGGSYGRGNGGVRQDRENGILYNDLDFFVFAREKTSSSGALLEEISRKYEKELKIDVDFSRVMTVTDIRKNAPRLMMQELKRGYVPVCGEDLLAMYLPEIPAEKLPFSEACRLLLNRGMGLLLAGEKLLQGSPEMDFILRNIYKAILGAGDAMQIASGKYLWELSARLEQMEKSSLPETWKALYHEAVEFKYFPCRKVREDQKEFWENTRDFFRFAVKNCAGEEDICRGLYERSCKAGEYSWKNFIRYCIKNRTLPLGDWRYYAIPSVAVLTGRVSEALTAPEAFSRESELYRQWLIFN